MPNAKPAPPRRFKVSEYRERRNAEAAIEIELDDGYLVFIPAPEFWPADFPITGSDAEQMRSILGDEVYAEMIEHGGNPRTLGKMFTEAQDLTAGE